MKNLTPITTAVEDGQERALQQFKDKGNIPEIQAVFLKPVQEFLDAAFALFPGRYLSSAVGAALTVRGQRVGMPRPRFGPAATNDEVFRALVYAKIAENNSHGTAREMQNIIRLLRGGRPQVMDLGSAAVQVQYNKDNALVSATEVQSILIRATHPIEITTVAHTGTPFGFMGDRTAYGFSAGQLGEAA